PSATRSPRPAPRRHRRPFPVPDPTTPRRPTGGRGEPEAPRAPPPPSPGRPSRLRARPRPLPPPCASPLARNARLDRNGGHATGKASAGPTLVQTSKSRGAPGADFRGAGGGQGTSCTIHMSVLAITLAVTPLPWAA